MLKAMFCCNQYYSNVSLFIFYIQMINAFYLNDHSREMMESFYKWNAVIVLLLIWLSQMNLQNNYYRTITVKDWNHSDYQLYLNHPCNWNDYNNKTISSYKLLVPFSAPFIEPLSTQCIVNKIIFKSGKSSNHY